MAEELKNASVKEEKKEKQPKAKKKTKKAGGQKVKKFFRDVRGEFKKVVWPTKKTIVNNTLIVIGVMVLCSLVVGGLDSILMALVNLVLRNA